MGTQGSGPQVAPSVEPSHQTSATHAMSPWFGTWLCRYLFSVAENLDSLDNYLNHSCNANLMGRVGDYHELEMVATRDIKVGHTPRRAPARAARQPHRVHNAAQPHWSPRLL